MSETRERPILFSGSMVRAILAGQKTQTRRVMKLRDFEPSSTPGYDWDFRDKRLLWHSYSNAEFLAMLSPYGVPGDRLWVRETWFDNYADRWDGSTATMDPQGCPYILYRADGVPDLDGEEWDMKWRPSIFMPRWASRITLDVTEVRVQRLQDISEEDIKAEGAMSRRCECSLDGERTCSRGKDCEAGRSDREWFQWLWDSINGQREGCSWESNPWVWAVSFRVLEKKP